MVTDNLRSIVAMCVAVGCFSLMDAVLKLLSAHYPVLQVAALRGATALPLVLLYVAWRGVWGQMWRLRWSLHLLRGVLIVAMLALFTYGVRGLPLTDAYTLSFIAPLLITLLAIPVLGERVPRSHWWAIALGLLGVVVALRPSGQGFLGWAGLATLAAAACYAASAVAGRLLCRTDAPESLVLWSMVMLTVGAGALAWPAWEPVQAEHGWLLLALAVTGFAGQLAITEAFRQGQASAVAPFEYTALAWGLGIDFVLWNTLPDALTLCGAAIIIAAGLIVLRDVRRPDSSTLNPSKAPQVPPTPHL